MFGDGKSPTSICGPLVSCKDSLVLREFAVKMTGVDPSISFHSKFFCVHLKCLFPIDLQRWSFPLILREWESGNGSFSFLRTLREWEWELEWVWVIRKNFARERKFFFWNRYRVGEVVCVKKSRFFWCSSLSKMSTFLLRK